MHEILFKAQQKGNHKWVYGLPAYENGELSLIVDKEGVRHQIHPDTLCQYIRLTDIHGKQIFDGDILNLGYNNRDSTYTVKWAVCGWWLYDEYDDECDCEVSIVDEQSGRTEFEVIGNIHDR